MKIVQLGIYNYNAGDIVLSKTVRDLFNKFAKIDWKIMNVRDKIDIDYINNLNKADKILFGGGGLFLPDSNPNNISGWQWACNKSMMNKIKKPIYAFALGYNYFYGQKPSNLFIDNLKFFINKCKFFSVRNIGSKRKILSLIGNKFKNKIKIQQCSTMFLNKIYKIQKNKGGNNLCLNISYDRPKYRYGKNEVKILNDLVEACNILNKKYNLFVYGHLNCDMVFSDLLKRRNIEHEKINFKDSNPENIIKFYNEMNIVIATRGHSILIPFGLNKIIIGINTHPKIKWFLEDINKNYFLDFNNLKNNLLNKIDKINNIETIDFLKKKQELFWAHTKKNIKEILK